MSLKLLYFFEFTQRVFEVASADINESNVALDFASSDVFHTIAALIDLKSLL